MTVARLSQDNIPFGLTLHVFNVLELIENINQNKKSRIKNKTMEELIINKIELANGIVEKLAKFQDIDGALKVKRNIIKEIQFLQKVYNNFAIS